jgi:hypothetical protein
MVRSNWGGGGDKVQFLAYGLRITGKYLVSASGRNNSKLFCFYMKSAVIKIHRKICSTSVLKLRSVAFAGSIPAADISPLRIRASTKADFVAKSAKNRNKQCFIKAKAASNGQHVNSYQVLLDFSQPTHQSCLF